MTGPLAVGLYLAGGKAPEGIVRAFPRTDTTTLVERFDGFTTEIPFDFWETCASLELTPILAPAKGHTAEA